MVLDPHLQCILNRSSFITVDGGGDSEVIQVKGGGGGVELDRSLDTSVVEEVHLEILNKVPTGVRRRAMETEGA